MILGCFAPLPNRNIRAADEPHVVRVSDEGLDPSIESPVDEETPVESVPGIVNGEPMTSRYSGPDGYEEDAPIMEGQNPHTIHHEDKFEYWEMSLDEAIHYALSHSKVMRELGAAILTAPDRIKTNYAASVVSSDPRTGIEAALSEFDAKFTAVGNFEKNHRAINNIFLGGGTRVLKQDLNTYQLQLSKQVATGTEFYVGNFTDYNSNNAPGNQFYGSWNSNVEVGARQSLLQGAGTDFNRIAGPKAQPGVYNGVLIARVNAKVSQVEFEISLRNFLSNVVNTYWDLYFAYRDLDSKIEARDAGLQLWREIQAKEGQKEAEADREALAQEQYYRLEEDVQNSLSGKQFDGTRTDNGTQGGTFRANGGVYLTERRLRLLIGVPISDDRLIRPSKEPEMTEVLYNWDMLVAEAKERRPELRVQELIVQRREMELIASRNFLKPKLDATARYRMRGFGNTLAGNPMTVNTAGGAYNSAWGNLMSGQFEEWQLGFEAEIPLGFRKAHSAVHNAELWLARERSVLREQERQVVHDLSQAVSEKDRAYAVVQTSYNRQRAARKLLNALNSRKENRRPQDLDKVLDAQRRFADATARYFLARVEYALAIKNVNFEKGSLLDFLDLMSTDAAIGRSQKESVKSGQVIGSAPNP